LPEDAFSSLQVLAEAAEAVVDLRILPRPSLSVQSFCPQDFFGHAIRSGLADYVPDRDERKRVSKLIRHFDFSAVDRFKGSKLIGRDVACRASRFLDRCVEIRQV
jgi:hypothetical protein